MGDQPGPQANEGSTHAFRIASLNWSIHKHASKESISHFCHKSFKLIQVLQSG